MIKPKFKGVPVIAKDVPRCADYCHCLCGEEGGNSADNAGTVYVAKLAE